MKNIALSLIALLLAACATSEPPSAAAPSKAASVAPSQTDAKLAQAVVTPLGDFNLVRADIPAVLSAAQKAPYGVPSSLACAALAADIQALDAVLGADLDTPPSATNPGLVERGVGAAGDAAVGFVRGAAEGVVPFRGWVRKLSGAERYSKDVAAAIAAGTIRRAYLKGLGQSQGCQAPAAPQRQVAQISRQLSTAPA